METRNEILEKYLKIIKENTSDENIKEMIKVLEEPDNNEEYVSSEKLKKLSQITYKDYASKKREK